MPRDEAYSEAEKKIKAARRSGAKKLDMNPNAQHFWDKRNFQRIFKPLRESGWTSRIRFRAAVLPQAIR